MATVFSTISGFDLSITQTQSIFDSEVSLKFISEFGLFHGHKLKHTNEMFAL